MAPVQLGKWLVLFCDEINLPDLDKYGKFILLYIVYSVESIEELCYIGHYGTLFLVYKIDAI